VRWIPDDFTRSYKLRRYGRVVNKARNELGSCMVLAK
jgi:hypothetical protein